MKNENSFEKHTYLTALDKADQDLLDTLAIAEVVIGQFHEDYPQITNVYAKSDNAGCYHANDAVEVLFKISKKYHIKLNRYDFSESQYGKDQCDREAAYVKSRYRSFLDSDRTHKITTAVELVTAIMAHDGPKNTKAVVLRIDKSKTFLTNKCPIANISNYHSYVPDDNGILYFEYYMIGKGNYHEFTNPEFICDVKKEMEWVASTRQHQEMTPSKRKSRSSIIQCTVPNCVAIFQSQTELLDHEIMGNHDFRQINTAKDRMRENFLLLKNSHIFDETQKILLVQNVQFTETQKKTYNHQYIVGWARPIRTKARFTTKQKEFITEMYRKGQENKYNKVSAAKIAEIMPTYIKNGEFYFNVEEFLDTQQIRGFISRLIKKDKKSRITENNEENEQNEENLDEVSSSVYKFQICEFTIFI